MEKVSNKDLGQFFNQWLYVPGQPDLKITTKPSERKGFTDLIIEQTQDYLFSFDIELQIKKSTRVQAGQDPCLKKNYNKDYQVLIILRRLSPIRI